MQYCHNKQLSHSYEDYFNRCITRYRLLNRYTPRYQLIVRHPYSNGTITTLFHYQFLDLGLSHFATFQQFSLFILMHTLSLYSSVVCLLYNVELLPK